MQAHDHELSGLLLPGNSRRFNAETLDARG